MPVIMHGPPQKQKKPSALHRKWTSSVCALPSQLVIRVRPHCRALPAVCPNYSSDDARIKWCVAFTNPALSGRANNAERPFVMTRSLETTATLRHEIAKLRRGRYPDVPKTNVHSVVHLVGLVLSRLVHNRRHQRRCPFCEHQKLGGRVQCI